MNSLSRRSFLRAGTVAAGALLVEPLVSKYSSVFPMRKKDIVFQPFPHPQMPELAFVYAADEKEDPFKSSINVQKQGIVIPEDFGSQKFSINTRWYVEGFGYVWLSADNEGRYYSVNDASRIGTFHLNYEFAKTRVTQNKVVLQRYQNEGTQFSSEVRFLSELSEELLNDAAKKLSDGERAARLADKSLRYSLWAGEKIELEKARSDIERLRRRDHVYFGCESRQYIWAKSEEFTKTFVQLFNFATVTHYLWDTWYELFEPREGQYNWGIKDNIVNWLTENNITIQGRPLFWFHPAVTPEWLKQKNFSELKQYVERHTKDVVGHYGDKVLQWEVVNEYHDWGNIFNHTPEQITEIVRLACETTKDVNPKVVRILNNCCPWAEYVARGRMAGAKATRPLHSPRKFIEDIHEAGVEYDVLGVQIYFPQRSLFDIARLLERFAVFGKPIYITEIGASSGPTRESVLSGQLDIPKEPYSWHRHWDEELQADWLEQVYTIFYSKPYVKAINWYDYSDFRPYIQSGGLVREDCSTKQSFHRLKDLLGSWGRLPEMKGY